MEKKMTTQAEETEMGHKTNHWNQAMMEVRARFGEHAGRTIASVELPLCDNGACVYHTRTDPGYCVRKKGACPAAQPKQLNAFKY